MIAGFYYANLAPEVRVKKDNFLIGAIIPGPKEPKDFNSFLAPIVSELQELEGVLLIHILNLKNS